MKNPKPNSFENALDQRLRKIEDEVVPTIAKCVWDLKNTSLEIIKELDKMKKIVQVLCEQTIDTIEKNPPYKENLN